MRRTLDLTIDAGTWTAVVDGDRVDLQNADESFIVRESGDGRWSVERVRDGMAISEDRRELATAASAGDVVWIGIRGHAIELRLRPESGERHPASRDQDVLRTPMSATVVRISVHPGDRVEPGDTLIVLEAMKMELPIRAPRAAVVRAIHCAEGQRVQPESVLVELE